MTTLEKNYKRALNEANEMPTHIDGKLQNTYQFFGENKNFSKIIYNEEITPASVFKALNLRYTRATRYYIQKIPTYRAYGNLKKMKDWDKKLMFHKAWAHTDIEIKNVNFDLIGIKRETTHLPAGVLIANVKFS